MSGQNATNRVEAHEHESDDGEKIYSWRDSQNKELTSSNHLANLTVSNGLRRSKWENRLPKLTGCSLRYNLPHWPLSFLGCMTDSEPSQRLRVLAVPVGTEACGCEGLTMFRS